jgi:hypothetical protein
LPYNSLPYPVEKLLLYDFCNKINQLTDIAGHRDTPPAIQWIQNLRVDKLPRGLKAELPK